jgi:glutamate racemase
MVPFEKPIGVFDSGLGGLTVLRELARAFPHESFVYLGDVARLPYGSKSKNVINQYFKRCHDYLLTHSVKAVVVACGTASSQVLPYESPIPLVGMVDSSVQATLDSGLVQKVLVLATEATVGSESYLKAFRQLAPGVRVYQKSCPLLVPLAEEGWWDHPITRQVIGQYLKGFDLDNLDAVILGCTHYPLLQASFRKTLPESVSLIHGGEYVAKELRKKLEGSGVLNGTGVQQIQFFATDSVPSENKIGQALFGRGLSFNKIEI